jgi:hypothetical protein
MYLTRASARGRALEKWKPIITVAAIKVAERALDTPRHDIRVA